MTTTKTKFKQSRNWAFTDFELLDFKTIYNDYKDIIRYICWGKEKCPKTNKIHYQGWLQLINKKTLGGVKRLLGTKKIHLESCRGSEFDNNKYCKKDGVFKFKGKFICQGQRTDLEQIKKMIDENEPTIKIAQNYFSDFIRYHSGFNKYAELVAKEQTKKFRKVKCTLINGPTNTNKTRRATEYTNDYYKIQGDQLNWFDGYQGEKTLIIDEYANDVKITRLLALLDGYQLRLPIKGGFTYARWNKVIITSNLRLLHQQADIEHQKALKRRITKHINLFEELPRC